MPSAPLVQGGDGLLYGVARYGGDFTVMLRRRRDDLPHGRGRKRNDAPRLRRRGRRRSNRAYPGTGRHVLRHDRLRRGARAGLAGPGPGTIFRIDASGNFTRLFVLPGWESGYRPGPLVQGADGALYGTAVGGSSLYARFPGVVFRFDPA